MHASLEFRFSGEQCQYAIHAAMAWRLFKAKMVLFANYPYPHFIDDEGNCIQHPHWFELAKQRWNYHYRSMRTPCSCWLCRGEKYNRREYKKDSLRIMKESME